MKKSRYTEKQIIGILKQHGADVKTADLWRQHCDVLRLEVEVWRDGRSEAQRLQ